MEECLKRLARMNVFLAVCFVATGCICAVACRATSIEVTAIPAVLVVLLVLGAGYAPVPAYWHQKGRIDRRDAALVIPWCLLTWIVGAVPPIVAARLAFPLRDGLFFAMDRSLGFDGSRFLAWSAHLPAAGVISATYPLLINYLEVAIVVPALLGKRESVRFLLANTMAFLIGIGISAVMPAIGPWIGEPVHPSALQLAMQTQLEAIRSQPVYRFSLMTDGAGIVAFPSFHVVWAVLAASAFWGWRWLRVPVALFSGMIVLSTLTTGWHYLTDVLAGLALAALVLYLAEKLMAAEAAVRREEAARSGA